MTQHFMTYTGEWIQIMKKLGRESRTGKGKSIIQRSRDG